MAVRMTCPGRSSTRLNENRIELSLGNRPSATKMTRAGARKSHSMWFSSQKARLSARSRPIRRARGASLSWTGKLLKVPFLLHKLNDLLLDLIECVLRAGLASQGCRDLRAERGLNRRPVGYSRSVTGDLQVLIDIL